MKVKKIIKEPQYILQGNDSTCRLITLLNFFIYKTGKSPIKYNSKKYNSLVLKCDDPESILIMENIQYAIDKLKLKLIDSPRFKSINRFKTWIIKNILKGECIDFYLRHKNVGKHSVLIIGYNKKKDSFKVINAQLFTNETPIEYISWEELTKEFYFKSKPSKMPYYNKKEKTSMVAKYVIYGTSIIKFI